MAIDPRIALGVQQPAFNNPFTALSDYRREREEAENRKRLTDSRVAADQAAIAENRAQTEAIQQKLQREQAEAQALQSWDGTPEMLQKIVGPERGHVILKGAEALKEQQIKSESALKENIGRVIGGIKALPTEDLRKHWYETVVSDYAQRGWIKPDQLQPYSPETLDLYQQWAMSPSEQAAANKPIELNKDTTLVDPKTGKVIASGPASTPTPVRPVAVQTVENGKNVTRYLPPDQASGQSFPSQPQKSAEGPQPTWQWVTRTGKDGKTEEVYTNRVVQGDRPQNARVKATEDERKTAGFYGQMSDSIKILDELEPSITQQELYQIQTLPQEKLVGLMNRNMLSESAKRYLRAFEQFTEARLRPVSGAAINDSEYERDRRTYAKQYGETPKLAADRAAARTRALESLKKRAGVALDDANADSGDVIEFVRVNGKLVPKGK